jgi:arsenite methyltransferase
MPVSRDVKMANKKNKNQMKPEDIKGLVKDKYGRIATETTKLASSGCCGSKGCCDALEFSMIGDEYQHVEGYNPDADLGLGCGLPTQYAGIKLGDHVLDLGSGAGNDCFVARAIVGAEGCVTGLDFTEAMVDKARVNAEKLGYNNLTFILGDIEHMPLADEAFDVVISNCVLNLVPDKRKAFAEVWRVLKPGGHFCVSDVVLAGTLPEGLRSEAELYVGCVAGALQQEDYLDIIRLQGFPMVTIHKQKPIIIPEAVLDKYLTSAEKAAYINGDNGIFSITVTGTKP